MWHEILRVDINGYVSYGVETSCLDGTIHHVFSFRGRRKFQPPNYVVEAPCTSVHMRNVGKGVNCGRTNCAWRV